MASFSTRRTRGPNVRRWSARAKVYPIAIGLRSRRLVPLNLKPHLEGPPYEPDIDLRLCSWQMALPVTATCIRNTRRHGAGYFDFSRQQTQGLTLTARTRTAS